MFQPPLQEIFAKRDNPEKGAKGNTHLICPEGAGQKYEAAMKWRLPIVSKEWLRACLRSAACSCCSCYSCCSCFYP